MDIPVGNGVAEEAAVRSSQSSTDASQSSNSDDKESSQDVPPLWDDNKGLEEREQAAKDTTGKFHVDRALIPSAQLDDQAFAELQGLGLDVFNQDDFEQGVMAQVDHILEKEDEERRKKIMEKDLKGVEDEILMVSKELIDVEKILKSLSSGKTEYFKRRIDSVTRQKENKLNQMKKLKARKRSLKSKLTGVAEVEEDEEDAPCVRSPDLNEVLGLTAGPAKETEREKLIRLGEMTPFGTVMSKERVAHSSEPKHKPAISLSQSSEFDQFFLDKDQSRIEDQKKAEKMKAELNRKLNRMKTSIKEESESKKKKTDSKKNKSDEEKSKKKNLFDKRDKKHYRDDMEGSYSGTGERSKKKYPRLDHNFQEDSMRSDEEDMYRDEEDQYLSSEDEYRPENGEIREFNEEHGRIKEKVKVKKKSKKKGFGRPKKPPKYYETSDSDSDNTPRQTKIKLERSDISNKARDDGSDYYYEKRMKLFNSAERKRMDRVENGEESEEEDHELDEGLFVPGRIWSRLFKYQRTGVKWLWELHCQQAGGIIGDEMGLGKTIQMISFLAALRQSKLRDKNFKYVGLGPTLIVCPTTVMHQWVKEFHTWWPLFRVAILHSSGTYTTSENDLVRTIVKERGVLVTSYNTLVLQQDHVLPYHWHYVVLDEGHKIRNPDAQATIACKQLRTHHRIILSGSPIQNNLKELWSLFDFIFPGKLGTLPDFMMHFSIPIVQGGYSNASQIQVTTAYKCACVLRDTINPYLLRRMKADVKIDLPSKNEQVLFCRLSDEQRDVYKQYLESRECQAILSGRFQVFAGLIALRKICNHPDICTGGPRLYIGEDVGEDETLEYGYSKRSGKMIVVEALLRLWKKQDHRVLLFTQSRAMLNILESFTVKQGYTYLKMDGGTPISARQPLITKYNKDRSIYLFLLTTKVGGLGVNLTGANRVIIFDPDWNPSTDLQARERTWRIGQQRQVTIYRLVTTGTIEEKIYHRQIFKQFLTNRILKDPKQRRFFKSNDLYELFELGSADNKEGSETSALFAGTGSEVFPKNSKSSKSETKQKHESSKSKNSKSKHKVKPNLFDKIQEEKEKHQIEEDNEDFEGEEIERMQELASKLSQKIKKEPEQENNSDSNNTANNTSSKKNQKQLSFLDHGKSSTNKLKDFKCPRKRKIKEETLESEHSSVGLDRLNTSDKSHKHRNGGEEASSKSHKHKQRNDEDESKGKKKHKKRKHKDAKFEGERIPHLVKQDVYKQGQDKEEQKKEHSAMDDYVLQKLFKKTGIQGALQHDVIMDASKHDYMIVEAEADRVAKEAVQALKRSRSQCSSAMSGVPTWTGQSGSVKKPRFGQKKNSLLVTKATKDDAAKQPIVPKKTETKITASGAALASATSATSRHHFDGTLAGNVVQDLETGATAAEMMTSDELLNRMRRRNEVTRRPAAEGEGTSDAIQASNPESFKLITDIRNFIMFECSMIGQASTDEILQEFGNKMPPSDSVKFRAMLNEICDFERNNGIGFWKLRGDFR